ncbi:MAG: CYTH domain-containing protein [Desulfobulbaceae bacterium]|nr:CYTH domain-containing protein [Desulfobulbaceae bacterium]
MMGTEIERKFLVRGTAWRIDGKGIRYCQGYLCLGAEKTVRVRTCGGRGFLTVKGPGSSLALREYEYEIPLRDAREMLESLCEKPLIIKDRYKIGHEGLIWEIDQFHGENSGLIIAEIELEREDQDIPLPDWIDREVSGDPRYFNASLVRNPWNTWNE